MKRKDEEYFYSKGLLKKIGLAFSLTPERAGSLRESTERILKRGEFDGRPLSDSERAFFQTSADYLSQLRTWKNCLKHNRRATWEDHPELSAFYLDREADGSITVETAEGRFTFEEFRRVRRARRGL